MIPVISPVTNFQNIQYGGNSLKPHILGCYPPDSMKHLIPVSVSLVETECPKSKPSNNVKVYFDKNESGHKKGVAVCSKSLSHPGDVSMRFIEWIELLRAQGVDKIFLSVLAVHPNVNKVRLLTLVEAHNSPQNDSILLFKVFRYYEALGVLEIRKTTLAGSQPNHPILTNMFIYQEKPPNDSYPYEHIIGNEGLSVNDCFLRNMQKYKYIANIDNDEIIVPKKWTTLLEMMKVLEKLSQNEVYSKI